MSQKTSWKNSAIKKSGGISDAWDVFISYAGRFAAWILFACMISNIVEVVVTLPAALISVVMVVQVITLDVAGFGLNTIAKQVAKHGDDEQKSVAKKANRLASFLIGLMILTLALVTVGYLVPSLSTDADLVNKGLILVRVIMIVLYMHTMHDLSDAAGEIAEKEVQTEQANDTLARENQQKIQAVSESVDTLAGSVHILAQRVDTMYTEQAAITKNVDMAVDTVHKRVDIDEFTRLADTVHSMKLSFTEVNQNILNITQNLYNMPVSTQGIQGLQPRNDVYTTRVDEINDAQKALQAPMSRDAQEPATTTVKALDVPVLEVPGVSPAKVSEVIAAYLSGTQWRNMQGNYSRTIKPIKEAYEKHVASQGVAVYSDVDTL